MDKKKNRKKDKKNKKKEFNQMIIIRIIIVLFILLMGFLIYYKVKNDTNEELLKQEKVNSLFSTFNSSTYVNVSKYIVYGTHFNIEGTLEINKVSGISIKNVNLIVKNLNDEETVIKSDYNYSDDIVSFSTSDEINSGLNLETLSNDLHYLLLKVSFSNGDINYYSLSNTTEYSDITYYTITKNNTNSKIEIGFDKYNDIPYMSLDVSRVASLPKDVYDVVIDPGHGGADAGAVYKEYKESSIVLDCAKSLKTKLESLGLKVLLTRDGTEDSNYKESNMYDEGGRVTTANESSAKLLISLHMNSNSDVTSGGLEVYAPCSCDLTLATSLAKNISQYSNANFSPRTSFKKADGVYVQYFTNADILAFKTRAIKGNYEPYNLTKSTPYLYMIREIGGICTNAFVDGRNPNYGTNEHYNSNVGIEGYLIELGYMKVQNDLQNILSNYDKYMEGISQSIKSFYNL